LQREIQDLGFFASKQKKEITAEITEIGKHRENIVRKYESQYGDFNSRHYFMASLKGERQSLENNKGYDNKILDLKERRTAKEMEYKRQLINAQSHQYHYFDKLEFEQIIKSVEPAGIPDRTFIVRADRTLHEVTDEEYHRITGRHRNTMPDHERNRTIERVISIVR
jgi:hypothetical protein